MQITLDIDLFENIYSCLNCLDAAFGLRERSKRAEFCEMPEEKDLDDPASASAKT